MILFHKCWFRTRYHTIIGLISLKKKKSLCYHNLFVFLNIKIGILLLFSLYPLLDLTLRSVVLKCQQYAVAVRGFKLISLAWSCRSWNLNVGWRLRSSSPIYHPGYTRSVLLGLQEQGQHSLSSVRVWELFLHVCFFIIKLDSTLKMFSKQSKMLQRSISFSNMVSSF